MRPLLSLLFLFMVSAATCPREDGEPDPPVQQLVPCDPDAGVDDPLACPLSMPPAMPPDAGPTPPAPA